jgi:hypothetical protein
LRIAPPSPPEIDEGSSPMIAPTILAVAEMRSAVKRYGSEVGKRSFQSTVQRFAAYERINSTARWSAAWSPRNVEIATGKKVRYAEMTATEIHAVTCTEESHTTTIGAIARIGTVCEATTYGRKPRWSIRECASSAPRTKPPVAPIAKPRAASFAVNAAALRSVTTSSGASGFGRSNSARNTVWMWGIEVSSTMNGCVQPKWIPSAR